MLRNCFMIGGPMHNKLMRLNERTSELSFVPEPFEVPQRSYDYVKCDDEHEGYELWTWAEGASLEDYAEVIAEIDKLVADS